MATYPSMDDRYHATNQALRTFLGNMVQWSYTPFDTKYGYEDIRDTDAHDFDFNVQGLLHKTLFFRNTLDQDVSIDIYIGPNGSDWKKITSTAISLASGDNDTYVLNDYVNYVRVEVTAGVAPTSGRMHVYIMCIQA